MTLRAVGVAVLGVQLALVGSGCGQSFDGSSVAQHATPITFGVPDGEGHPYVVSVVFRPDSASPWVAGCTGTLIAPHVVATAAHCYWLYEGNLVGVTFDPVVGESPEVISGEYVMNPEFALDFSTMPLHDNAVVKLDRRAAGVRPARLPPAGLLDALAAAGLLAARRFDSVGYGIVEPVIDPQDPENPIFDFTTLGTRRVAVGTFMSLSATNLLISQNPTNGDGGTCFFDSGGPNFFEGTNIIAGQTQGGDALCLETNDTLRLDTPDARRFLGRFVDLPTGVPVCHNGHATLEAPVPAAVVHLLHGDALGSCP